MKADSAVNLRLSKTSIHCQFPSHPFAPAPEPESLGIHGSSISSFWPKVHVEELDTSVLVLCMRKVSHVIIFQKRLLEYLFFVLDSILGL